MKSPARDRSSVARPQAHYRTDSGGISIELVIYAAGIALFAAAVIGGALIVFGRVQNSNAQQALEEAVDQAEQHYTRLTPSGRLNFAGADSPTMDKLIRLYNDPVNRGDLRWFGIERAEINAWNDHQTHRGLWSLAVDTGDRTPDVRGVVWPTGEDTTSESDIWIQANLLPTPASTQCVPRAVASTAARSPLTGTSTTCAVFTQALPDNSGWQAAWAASGGMLGYSVTAGVLPWRTEPPQDNALGAQAIGLSAPGQVVRMGLRSASGDTYCAIIVKQSSNSNFVGKSYHALPAEAAVQTFHAGASATPAQGIASCGMAGNSTGAALTLAQSPVDGLIQGLQARAFYSPNTATRRNAEGPSVSTSTTSNPAYANMANFRAATISAARNADRQACQRSASPPTPGVSCPPLVITTSSVGGSIDAPQTATLLSPVPLDP